MGASTEPMLRVHRAAQHSRRWVCSKVLTPSAAYFKECEAGKITRDDRQVATLQHLDRVCEHLKGYVPVGAQITEDDIRETKWRGLRYDAYGQPIVTEEGSGYFANNTDDSGSLFGSMRQLGASLFKSEPKKLSHQVSVEIPDNAPKGAYIYGGVGCGKSHVMRMFHELAPLPPDKKLITHFHPFMLRVHKAMEKARINSPDLDPLAVLCVDLCAESHLICFDEFQVTDVADALLMRRLFGRLWEA